MVQPTRQKLRVRQQAFWALVIVAIVVGWFVTHPSHGPGQTAAVASASTATRPKWPPDLEARYISLRDEALTSLGWIAGNAKGHSNWTEVEKYVGADGQYTSFYEKLATPSSNDGEADAFGNIQTYQAGVRQGSAAAFSTDEEYGRTNRVVQIAGEITAIMKQVK